MLITNQLVGYASGATPSVSATAVESGTEVATDNQNSYTFSSVALGTSTADRLVVVLLSVNGWTSAISASTMTIDGNAATEVILKRSVGGNTQMHVAIFSYALGAGNTSGDIVITGVGGNYDDAEIFVYDMKGANATATATASDSDNATANAVTGSLTIPANGACLAIHRAGNTTTTTWASDGGMSETWDAATGSSASYHNSIAESFPASEQTSITVSATPSGTAGPNVMCAAAWQPS